MQKRFVLWFIVLSSLIGGLVFSTSEQSLGSWGRRRLERRALLETMPTGETAAKPAPSDFRRISAEFLKPDGKIVLVSAHRGLSGLSTGQWMKTPENSLAAIRRSIATGVDIIEIDVRKTKDGHLVLMHDATVDRTTDGCGKVADLTLAEIRALRLTLGDYKTVCRPVSGERVPTLEEAMLLCKGKCLVNIDKAQTIVPECYQVLKKTNTLSQAIFLTMFPAEKVRKEQASLSPPPLYKPTLLNGKKWNEKKLKGWEIIAPYVEAVHPPVFELVFRDDADPMISAETIAKVKKNGARVWANTLWDSLCNGHTDAKSLIDPKDGWGWMIDRGVNIIQTDEAEKLLEYLRARKLHW